MDFEYDVFLSYSSKDKDIVHPLAERLKQDGVRVWLDKWVIQPGDPISMKIQHGIEKSRTLFMFMAPDYFEAEWGKLEHHPCCSAIPPTPKDDFSHCSSNQCQKPHHYRECETASRYGRPPN